MIDRLKLLETIQEDPGLKWMRQASFNAGDPIISEGGTNRFLYLLLKGEVELQKDGPEGSPVRIDHLRPGDMVGLVSFISEGPALTTAIALSQVDLLRINRREYEGLVEGTSSLSPYFHHLIIDSLLKRYQTTVGLQMKFENLTHQLHRESDQLRSAMAHLEAVQQQMISQEKMALLGELSAGISHELNNPTAALSRSVEQLNDRLGQITHQVRVFSTEQLQSLLDLGKNDRPVATAEIRNIASALEEKQTDIPRAIIRKLARYPETARSYLLENISRRHLAHAVEVYETGQILSIMGESTIRITSLVQSLRGFIRPSTGYEASLDVREGLLSTIQLFQHKLKVHELALDLGDIPPVAGNPGELNQVWTNILDNACDALNSEKGKITVRTGHENGLVLIDIINNGPKIHDEVKKRIFEANYTTKNTNGTFGLGIGLTITKDIIAKHKGQIHVLDADGGGAWFRISLPAVLS